MGKGNLAELSKITTFMRKNGILKYQNAQFSIQISRQALRLPRPRINKKDKVPGGTIEMPGLKITDPEMLFWSSTPQGI
jgi:hypothetical protein